MSIPPDDDNTVIRPLPARVDLADLGRQPGLGHLIEADDRTNIAPPRTSEADESTHFVGNRDAHPIETGPHASRTAFIPVDPASPLGTERYDMRVSSEPIQAVRQDFNQPATRRRREVPHRPPATVRPTRRGLFWGTLVVILVVAGAAVAVWVL